MPELYKAIEDAVGVADIKLCQFVDDDGSTKWVAELRLTPLVSVHAGQYCICHAADTPEEALEAVASTIRECRPPWSQA